MSVCAFLTSILDKYFQHLHLKAVHFNIEMTTIDKNQNHLSRVYLLHISINLKSAVNMFTCFQLDISNPFTPLQTLQTRMPHQLQPATPEKESDKKRCKHEDKEYTNCIETAITKVKGVFVTFTKNFKYLEIYIS